LRGIECPDAIGFAISNWEINISPGGISKLAISPKFPKKRRYSPNSINWRQEKLKAGLSKNKDKRETNMSTSTESSSNIMHRDGKRELDINFQLSGHQSQPLLPA
jgi:hypothetical protein